MGRRLLHAMSGWLAATFLAAMAAVAATAAERIKIGPGFAHAMHEVGLTTTLLGGGPAGPQFAALKKRPGDVEAPYADIKH
jgi:hypothetical protein